MSDIEHYPLPRVESEEHPYKSSQCSCGAWFYLWESHMECIASGCNCWEG